ncbi:MAG: transcriptional regulator, partial [Pseudomonadota bacterium]
MNVQHPINDELLMGYAAGLLPEAYDLMVATAVSLDDDARARLSGYEAMGGTLLAEAEVAPLRDDSFEAVMNRISGT